MSDFMQKKADELNKKQLPLPPSWAVIHTMKGEKVCDLASRTVRKALARERFREAAKNSFEYTQVQSYRGDREVQKTKHMKIKDQYQGAVTHHIGALRTIVEQIPEDQLDITFRDMLRSRLENIKETFEVFLEGPQTCVFHNTRMRFIGQFGWTCDECTKEEKDGEVDK